MWASKVASTSHMLLQLDIVSLALKVKVPACVIPAQLRHETKRITDSEHPLQRRGLDVLIDTILGSILRAHLDGGIRTPNRQSHARRVDLVDLAKNVWCSRGKCSRDRVRYSGDAVAH